MSVEDFTWKEFLYETRKLQGEGNATSTAPPTGMSHKWLEFQFRSKSVKLF